MIGDEIYEFCGVLWPINRSITGEGVRTSLEKIQSLVPELQIRSIKSGSQVFDWVVPKEWMIREAWIKDPSGKVICDFKRNNLHVVGYSVPVNKKMLLSELDAHLFSLREIPDAVPYVTSYYEENWGFCISHNERLALQDGEYEVFIDSALFDGSLNFGEIYFQGDTHHEVFLSTYICHPSMANNELSGVAVLTFIAKYLAELTHRKYSYRIVFVPETIGSIAYLSQNIETMKANIFAGFNLTCIGDDRSYSYLPSRNGNTYSDKLVQHVLRHLDKDYKSYSWNDRGSDERQYCAPGIDLPVASIMRTKYGEYQEYHTSYDTLGGVVTASGLAGGYNAVRQVLTIIERNQIPIVDILGEPQMGRRDLYPALSKQKMNTQLRNMMNVISYSDGTNTLLEIAEKCNIPAWEVLPIIEQLASHDVVKTKSAFVTKCEDN
jgi:aminopeptidase-like protein